MALSPECWQLTRLTILHLGNNRLGSLPPETGQLSQLQVLNLHQDRFSRFPETINQLASLNHLYLDDNFIARLPSRIGQLIHLQQLWLGGNHLNQSSHRDRTIDFSDSTSSGTKPSETDPSQHRKLKQWAILISKWQSIASTDGS